MIRISPFVFLTAFFRSQGSIQSVLAESARKIVVQSPQIVIGPTQVTVKEGTKETTAQFRNLRVDLSAPKTTLRRGESTELHIKVQGLQGITQPVPLHLTNGGAVTMSGGNMQTMSIKPSDVQGTGTFTTNRTITGVQTGGWIATATVVNFSICIQDDTDPSRVLLFNVATSDFVFCQGRGENTNVKPIEISTFSFGTDFNGVRMHAGDAIDSAPKLGEFSIGPARPSRRMALSLSLISNSTRRRCTPS